MQNLENIEVMIDLDLVKIIAWCKKTQKKQKWAYNTSSLKAPSTQ